jgi:hypothetical protein
LRKKALFWKKNPILGVDIVPGAKNRGFWDFWKKGLFL